MAEEFISKDGITKSIISHAAKVGTDKELYQLAHEHVLDLVKVQPALDVGRLVMRVCESITCAKCPFCINMSTAKPSDKCSFSDERGNIPFHRYWDAESGIAKYNSLEGADNGNRDKENS